MGTWWRWSWDHKVWHESLAVHVGWVCINPWEPKHVGWDLHPSFSTHPWYASSHQCTEISLPCSGNSTFLRNETAKPPHGCAELVTGHGPLITHFNFLGLSFPDPAQSVLKGKKPNHSCQDLFLYTVLPLPPTLTLFLTGAPAAFGAGGAGARRYNRFRGLEGDLHGRRSPLALNKPWISVSLVLVRAHPCPMPEEHVAVLNVPHSTTRTV